MKSSDYFRNAGGNGGYSRFFLIFCILITVVRFLIHFLVSLLGFITNLSKVDYFYDLKWSAGETDWKNISGMKKREKASRLLNL